MLLLFLVQIQSSEADLQQVTVLILLYLQEEHRFLPSLIAKTFILLERSEYSEL